MRYKNLKHLIVLLLPFIVVTIISTHVFAVDNVVETTFFGNLKDDGAGCGVYTILNLIVDILSIGIGILAVIGITIVGTKYLTAKDNIDQVKKAKHRMFQIVIGLIAYVLLYAGVQWLLPGGKLNANQQCTTISDAELASLKEEASQNDSANSSNQKSNPTPNGASSNECLGKALDNIKDQICQIPTASERIAKAAELLAIPYGKNASQKRFTKPNKWSQISGAKPPKYFQNAYDKYRKGHWKLYSKKFGNVTRVGASCDVFVSTVLKSTGYTNPKGYTHGAIRSKLKDKNKWKVVKSAKRGDVCQKGDQHVRIYLGNNRVAEAQSGVSSGNSRFGHIAKGGCKGYTIYRAIK